jgi:hypothetical protein
MADGMANGMPFGMVNGMVFGMVFGMVSGMPFGMVFGMVSGMPLSMVDGMTVFMPKGMALACPRTWPSACRMVGFPSGTSLSDEAMSACHQLPLPACFGMPGHPFLDDHLQFIRETKSAGAARRSMGARPPAIFEQAKTVLAQARGVIGRWGGERLTRTGATCSAGRSGRGNDRWRPVARQSG